MDGAFRIGDYLIEPDLNQISTADSAHAIEPKVMEVLVYLASHAGDVLPKERIIRAVWSDTFVTDDVLMHAVSELRKAFADDAKNPQFIQTIPKRGYRLITPVVPLKEAASRYEIKEKLGVGGMSEVFLARDTELRRKVALKFLLEQKPDDDSSGKRLLREARAAATLNHPYICNIHETGQMDGKTFIAMEYVEGQTLTERLSEGPMQVTEALRIGVETAEALQAAHDKGIVHRDIKPSNIMLTTQGHVKVMDFGIAKRLTPSDGETKDTTTGLVGDLTTRGTVPYMSPEQLRGEEVDHRTDVFSFGTVLYEMLTGVHPFRRPAQAETLGAILRDDPPPMSERVEGIPESLHRTVSKMLAKDPARRYPSARAVRVDLKDVKRQSDSVSRTAASGAPFLEHSRPKRRVLAAAAVGISVMAAAVILWYLGMFPSSLGTGSAPLTQDLYSLGVSYLQRSRKDDNEAAIELFKRALEIDPKSARARAGLALAYKDRVHLFGYPTSWLDNAVEEAEEAVRLDPDSPEAYTALARSYHAKGFLRRAEDAIAEALELHPQSDTALYVAGFLHFFGGRVVDAYQNFREALQLNPRSPLYYGAVGFVHIAVYDYPTAEQWINDALELQKDHTWTLDLLCGAYTHHLQYDLLKTTARRLADVAPDSVQGWLRLGDHAYRTSNYSEARDYLEQAHSISQYFYRWAAITPFLAQTYLKLGDTERARPLLRQSRLLSESRIESGDEGYEPLFDLAVVDAIEGKTDESVSRLRQAAALGGITVFWVIDCYAMLAEALADNPEFHKLLRELRAEAEVMRGKVKKLEKEWEEK